MQRASLLLAMGSAVQWLLVPAVARACAVCGTGPGIVGDPTARGFYWGILFLMALPFVVAGSIGGWLVYRIWRARADPWWRVYGGVVTRTQRESGQ
jgi:hypothetical protein